MVVNFPVTWNRRSGAGCWIPIDGVFSIIPLEAAAVFFQVPDQVQRFM